MYIQYMHVRPYEHLVAWQESHRLCLRTYTLTSELPSSEKFGLISQMRRASYGVPMNIAEGNARRSSKDKMRFMEISLASLEELHYQYVLCRDLGYLGKETFREIDDQIQRTSYLITKLRHSFSTTSSDSFVSSESSASSVA